MERDAGLIERLSSKRREHNEVHITENMNSTVSQLLIKLSRMSISSRQLRVGSYRSIGPKPRIGQIQLVWRLGLCMGVEGYDKGNRQPKELSGRFEHKISQSLGGYRTTRPSNYIGILFFLHYTKGLPIGQRYITFFLKFALGKFSAMDVKHLEDSQ